MDVGTIDDGRQPLDGLAQARLAELRRAQGPNGIEGTPGEEAGRAIEELFASMLVKELRRGLSTGFFEGPGSQVYTAWLDEHLGRTLAERDALGLAGMVKTYVERDRATTGEEQGDAR